MFGSARSNFLGSTTVVSGSTTRAFVPTDDPSLAAWFDANLGVTTTGTAVTVWTDQSSNHYTASQSTTAAEPALVAGGSNSIGSAAALRFTAAATPAQGFSSTTLPKQLGGFSIVEFGAGNRLTVDMSTTGGTNIIFTTGIPLNTAPYLLIAVVNLTTAYLYVNGTLQNTVTGLSSANEGSFATLVYPRTEPNSSPRFYDSSSTTTWLMTNNAVRGQDADVGFVNFYKTPMSAYMRQKLEGWALWKWGLQANLPSGHPYASAAPTTSHAPTGPALTYASSEGDPIYAQSGPFGGSDVAFDTNYAATPTSLPIWSAGNGSLSYFARVPSTVTVSGAAVIFGNASLNYFQILANGGMYDSAFNATENLTTDGNWHWFNRGYDSSGEYIDIDGVNVYSSATVYTAPANAGYAWNIRRFYGGGYPCPTGLALAELALWSASRRGQAKPTVPYTGGEANLLYYWRLNGDILSTS